MNSHIAFIPKKIDEVCALPFIWFAKYATTNATYVYWSLTHGIKCVFQFQHLNMMSTTT
jgi:hypothetical protein